MIDFTTLHEQNHRITESAQVLVYLSQDRGICEVYTTRMVFQQVITLIDDHLVQVDRLVKQHLLTGSELKDQNLGRKLSAESALLRQNFSNYAKRWTSGKRAELHIRDHDRFIKDTNEIFEMMLERIERETELIFPLLQSISEKGVKAA